MERRPGWPVQLNFPLLFYKATVLLASTTLPKHHLRGAERYKTWQTKLHVLARILGNFLFWG